ncbi:unnamed protein product, partial [Mesorhabditis belari]|uniref:glycogenin glucosyltransferase n=1 Tax=Mesorhabditis belari TaxID=2138241 RepID=A0AAF3FCJ3_9BILA
MAFASLATNTTEAFVTLATNDDYSLGALVLGYSLREATTSKKLHCMITEQVTTPVREQLQRVYDDVSIVDVLASNDEANLALIGRPDLALAFTKLNCWRLTQYSKAVFLDADTLVLRNTYRALLHKATTEGSFDGADQGLLNSFFSGWREASSAFRLSFIYNVTGGIFYTYAAAYKKLRDQVKIVHFIGTQKPWRGGVGIQMPEFAQIWHRIYERHVAGTVPGSSGTGSQDAHSIGASPTLVALPKEVQVSCVLHNQAPPTLHVDASPSRIVVSLESSPIVVHKGSSIPISSANPPHLQALPSTNPEPAQSDQTVPVCRKEIEQETIAESRSRWEQGRPDFTGKDAFAEIQEALMKNLQ